MKLPIFKNKIELEKTNWKHYLNYIYGDIPDNKFPIDINQFDILYTNLIDKYNIELTDDCIINNNYDNCYSKCPNNDLELYSNMSNVLDMKNTIWIYHKSPYEPIPNNTSIEVTHVSDAFTGQDTLEETSSWMYKATGSGIFFNTGNTISFKDHSEGVKYFLNIIISCPIREECAGYFNELFKKAGGKGYDSIQFLGHQDMRCGNTAIEIVDLHGVGNYPCGNKNKLNIKSGWGGVNKCICDNKKHSMNCMVNNNMVGGLELYKLKPYNFMDYINIALTHKQTTLNFLISFIIYICLLITIYLIIKYKINIKFLYKIVIFIIILIISIPIYRKTILKLS
jgi:hypothetical protein